MARIEKGDRFCPIELEGGDPDFSAVRREVECQSPRSLEPVCDPDPYLGGVDD